jgi:NAD(P)-dependent dehydrogenase (short-subunit alcohol dehydrogenase family)
MRRRRKPSILMLDRRRRRLAYTDPGSRDGNVLTLAGKGAIVAGTRRIGAVVVERLVRESINVAILYRSSREAAERQAEAARARGVKALALQADLTDEGQVGRAVEAAREALGNVSFSLNLASDYPRVSLEQLDAAAWEAGTAAAKGTYLLAAYSARAMSWNEGPTRGHLIFFGDWAAGETPYLDYLPYLTGKAAVHYMTRNFALELASRGILVNAVLPGPTEKPPDLSDRGWQIALEQAPLRRESSEDDIAELIVTLLRLETITGETIRVDSGRHIAGTAQRDAGGT